MKTRSFVAPLLVFALLAALLMGLIRGCGLIHRTQSVTDVTKTETITLERAPLQGHIHSLTITCSGEIQGTAEIRLMGNGKHYRTEKLSGPVKFEWGTIGIQTPRTSATNPSRSPAGICVSNTGSRTGDATLSAIDTMGGKLISHQVELGKLKFP